MSVYSECMSKIKEISDAYTRNFNDDLQASLDILDKFAEEFLRGRSNNQEQSQRANNPLTTLQSINEDEDESNKSPATVPDRKSAESTNSNKSSSESNENRLIKPKKRSKDEVDGHFSPELDKRQKRNASVRAQSIISKQVNVNLTQKLRRERSTDKSQVTQSRVCKEDDKENAEPVTKIKQEKLSLPAEPMEVEEVRVKREPDTDGLTMPPPAAPLPRSRKAAAKEKIEEDSQEESESGKRHTTRSKRPDGLAEAMPPPPVPSTRSGRASTRARAAEAAGATGATEAASDEAAPAVAVPEPRPKRTRAKKKPTDETVSDKDIESLAGTIVPVAESAPAPAAPDTRPKRTRAKKKPTEETDSGKDSESLGSTIVPAAEAAPAPAAPETRPKRTRAKKKPTEEVEPAKQPEALPDEIASPAEKKSKRTQRKAAEKLEQQDREVPPSVEAVISPKEERISQSEQQSPILSQKTIQKSKLQDQSSKEESKLQNSTSKEDAKLQKQTSKEDIKLPKQTSKEDIKLPKQTSKENVKLQKQTSKEDIKLQKQNSKEEIKLKKNAEKLTKYVCKLPKKINNETHLNSKDLKVTLVRLDSEELDGVDVPQSSCDALEKTRVLSDCEAKSVALDQTVVLPTGLYNHAPVTPKNIRLLEETIIIEKVSKEAAPCDDIPKTNGIMDATVVLDKDPKPVNMLDSNASIMTDDASFEAAPAPEPAPAPATPQGRAPPAAQPSSAVKEKVQQFEELASRNTRTKTRAMAKKEEKTETETPPDQKSKPVLSADTLNKMNNLIFSGKAPMTTQSASKPRAIPPPAPSRPLRPASVSASASAGKPTAAAEQLRRETEDARRKKEALLEAKREEHRRKREEKMAAAAATREAAERERRAALEAAARERRDRQALADVGRAERARGAERKKQELARKMAEMEERRRVEEEARLQRLADEQRRAEARRRQQLEETERMRKEEMLMAKEIEKRHKEYMEKQKRHKDDRMVTPSKMAAVPGTPGAAPAPRLPPAHMADGFQFLHSDEEQDEVAMPVPAWSTSKARQRVLAVQARLPCHLVDRLFSVRAHSPDLREIFPGVDRRALKRTSSAVWRTPTHAARLPMVHESPI